MSIQSIPTKFAGINFRSRLEAKWAAMFSLMGLEWEYEPFDAAGYIPDFVLMGADPVLVEVKPAVTRTECGSYVNKIEEAMLGAWDHDILIVGATPILPSQSATAFVPEYAIGVLGEWLAGSTDDESWPSQWMWGLGIWNRCGLCGLRSFRHDEQHWRSRVCGHGDGDHYLGPVNGIREAWAHATNVCQWSPRHGRRSR